MAGAGTDNDSRSILDIIIANFNQRWFSGWDAPADERHVKMYRVAREIIATPQYQPQIVGNPDRDEADAAFNRTVSTASITGTKASKAISAACSVKSSTHKTTAKSWTILIRLPINQR